MKVLVAEDDLTNKQLLREYLRPYGRCDFSGNGEEAVALFISDLEDGEPYDVVFLDFFMPVMDGHEALSAMRAAEEKMALKGRSKTPIIMLTSLDSEQARNDCFHRGCTDYIIKPVDLVTLVQKLRKLNLITEDEGWSALESWGFVEPA